MNWDDMQAALLDACMTNLGSGVTYQPKDSDEETDITAIFDNAAFDVDFGNGGPVQSSQPWLGVKLADLPADPQIGDFVTAKGNRYRVIKIEPDGQGGARLTLRTDNVDE